MSKFLKIVGLMLGLIALYLVLEHFAGAADVISSLAAGGMAIFGTLQGRSVSAYGSSVAAQTVAT